MINCNTQLKGFDRVMNALKGEPAERPPFGMLLSLYGKNYVDCTLQEYYTNAELYFKGQSKIIEKFDPDFITTPFVLSFEGEFFGSTLKYFSNYPPLVKKPAITSYTEINKLKIPKLNLKLKKHLLHSAELLASKFKNEKLIAGLTLSNIDSPALIMGIEGWLDTLLFQKEAAQELIKKTTSHFIEYANTFFQKGIDVLVVSNMFSNPQIVTNKILNELTLDYLAQALKQINGPVIIHHGGAQLGNFLALFCNLPNVIGFAIDSKDDLLISRSKIGNKLLLGNIDTHTISLNKIESIQEKTNNILRNRSKDNNFIFFNSNADILLETPEENILTVCKTVKNFRN